MTEGWYTERLAPTAISIAAQYAPNYPPKCVPWNYVSAFSRSPPFFQKQNINLPCPPDYISYCQDKCIYNGDREGGFYTREKRELSPTLRYYDKVQFQNFTPINPE